MVCPACGYRTASSSPTVTLSEGSASSVLLPDDTPGGGGASEFPSVMGPATSLSQVGLEGGVTLAPPPAEGGTTTVASTGGDDLPGLAQVLRERPGVEKYIVAGEVARGGMGAILRAVDRDVRRDVAVKMLLRGGSPRLRERFIEEAQITGQLEHPNIVPVHELGVDADGRLFFTMKLVRGKSLAQILAERRRNAVIARLHPEQPVEPEPSLRRQMRNYLAILNAVAFAHDRGVVHRDLKPANVMIGDFGEVLVMDWGLAKVRHGAQWTRRTTHFFANEPALEAAHGHAPSGRAADEALGTIIEAFRSQDGSSDHAIEGTPAYMAPEQARGEIDAIDERSDIYSLGAILYEILTLSPPVRGKSIKAILEDVAAGRVMAPNLRAPERQIPPELAAIAMKALAHGKEDRYPSVVDLRRDIELFMEDRTVSAKEDSTWEVLVKLIRRNAQMFISIAVATLVVVAVAGFAFRVVFLERERLKDAVQSAQASIAALRQEQAERQREQQRAAPALVAKARRAAERKEFADALQDVELAIAYDAGLAEARLLRAQLHLHGRAFAPAALDLVVYLSLRPDDQDARRLAELCAQATSGSNAAAVTSAIADVLVRQGAATMAEGLFSAGRQLVAAYRDRLERAWPGCTTGGFAVDKDNRLSLDSLAGRSDVVDLAPLEGMPLVHLDISRTTVIDLGPLKGMPLVRLDATGTAVRSLDPLQGMAITSLALGGTRVADIAPLAGMPLENLDAVGTDIADIAPLAGMPLTVLRLGSTHVADLGPLKGMHLQTLDLRQTRVSNLGVLRGMPLTELDISGSGVTDLGPLKGMRLSSLRATGTRIVDLSPLKGMPTTLLAVDGTRVADLAPLKGMPLRTLLIARTPITDLAPLIGMTLSALDLTALPVADLAPVVGLPLSSLVLAGTPVADLAPVARLKLSYLSLANTRVADLAPLRGMALAGLDLSNTPVMDLAPLAGMPIAGLILEGTAVTDLRPLIGLPLKELRLNATRITDLGPLAGLPLERLVLPPVVEKGLESLRTIPTLRQIGVDWDGAWPPVPAAEEFWRRLDAGEAAGRGRQPPN